MLCGGVCSVAWQPMCSDQAAVPHIFLHTPRSQPPVWLFLPAPRAVFLPAAVPSEMLQHEPARHSAPSRCARPCRSPRGCVAGGGGGFVHVYSGVRAGERRVPARALTRVQMDPNLPPPSHRRHAVVLLVLVLVLALALAFFPAGTDPSVARRGGRGRRWAAGVGSPALARHGTAEAEADRHRCWDEALVQAALDDFLPAVAAVVLPWSHVARHHPAWALQQTSHAPT